MIGLFKFMLDENPMMYLLQQEIRNKLDDTIVSFTNVFTDVPTPTPTPTPTTTAVSQ
jgi:hypothetical protein